MGRLILTLAGTLMLNACATQQPGDFTPPRLRHPGPEVQIPDVDVLEVTPAMENYLERYILPYENSEMKIHLLVESSLTNGVLNFNYDETRTLTAGEAFSTHSGNCVGFSNMMIALARRAGLNARYQEIIREREWSRDEETMLLLKHLNVFVETARTDYVIDVSGLEISPNARRRIVEDNYAKALYLNNLGAEALIENNLPLAYAYMTKAIAVEPLMTDSLVNLSVVFRRNDQTQDAITVLKRALEIDDSQTSAMNNLYEIYVELEDQQSALALQARVERYRRDNPYHLINLSIEARELGHYEESIRLAKNAIKLKEDDHQLYFELAKSEYLSGKESAAEKSMVRARELASRDMQAYYTRPLDELIAEEQAEQALLAE